MGKKTFEGNIYGTDVVVETCGLGVDIKLGETFVCCERSQALAIAGAIIEAAGGRPVAEPAPAKPEFLDHPDVTWPYLVTKRESGWSTNLPQGNGFVYSGTGKGDSLASLTKRKQGDYPDGYAIYTLAAVVGPEPKPQPLPEREVVTL